jgi:hypothetical protein
MKQPSKWRGGRLDGFVRQVVIPIAALLLALAVALYLFERWLP